jgi:hypothetical protein
VDAWMETWEEAWEEAWDEASEEDWVESWGEAGVCGMGVCLGRVRLSLLSPFQSLCVPLSAFECL